ncbi:MAG: RNA methyltransferase [Rhodospirillaceae bacterium]|nr:RNA methyltransferase [Rhodospirillaceae bacterium]
MAKSKRPRGQKSQGKKAGPQPAAVARQRASPRGPLMLWGLHPVRAALANPQRRILAGWTAGPAPADLADTGAAGRRTGWETVTAAQLAARLPDGAVHQGIAVAAEPLPRVSLDTVLEAGPAGPLVVLDRVTDPQNVGAILRSCAVFGASALIATDRHAPPESGALAKAAAGALEIVPWVRVANLARALARIREAGRWVAGLDGGANATIGSGGPAAGYTGMALVLGAEGAGLRRLTRENCDILVRIPMAYANKEESGNFIDSLNVSNAAAVALYELCRDRTVI